MYKVGLADDHAIFRAGLKSLINQDSQFQVVAEAHNGIELLEKLKSVKCDLVVLDLSMPEMDGIAAIPVIRQKYPKTKLLILTMQKDAEHFKLANTKGADGYLLKDDAYDQLILGMKVVMKGKKYISPKISGIVADRFVRSLDEADAPSLEILTPRERQVLKYVAQGLANKTVAVKLKISIRTVETHRVNLTNKLGIKTTARLVKYALEKGLI